MLCQQYEEVQLMSVMEVLTLGILICAVIALVKNKK